MQNTRTHQRPVGDGSVPVNVVERDRCESDLSRLTTYAGDYRRVWTDFDRELAAAKWKAATELGRRNLTRFGHFKSLKQIASSSDISDSVFSIGLHKVIHRGGGRLDSLYDCDDVKISDVRESNVS